MAEDVIFIYVMEKNPPSFVCQSYSERDNFCLKMTGQITYLLPGKVISGNISCQSRSKERYFFSDEDPQMKTSLLTNEPSLRFLCRVPTVKFKLCAKVIVCFN